jgi:O-antigen/teichoic acid export membrane protein
MQLGAVLLFLMTFMGSQIAVMTGFQDFRGLAITTVIVGIASLPIYVIGCYYYGMTGVVIASIFCTMINVLTNSLFIYRNTNKYQICYSFTKAFKEISILWQSNMPIVLSSITFCGMNWIVQVLLARQPNSAQELGYYYAAMNYVLVITFAPQLLGQVFFPILNQVNKEQLLQTGKKYILLSIVMVCAVALPVMFFSRFIMGLNGADFVDGWLVLVFISIYCIFNIVSIPCWQVIWTQNNKIFWNIFYWGVIEAIIVITSAYILLECNYGAIGIVIACILGRCFELFVYVTVLLKQR